MIADAGAYVFRYDFVAASSRRPEVAVRLLASSLAEPRGPC
jgi:hypothetical protein